MIYKILTIILGWLLCGAWAIRMEEKEASRVVRDWLHICCFYGFGPIALVIGGFLFWPSRLWKFAKGIGKAWKEAMQGDNHE